MSRRLPTNNTLRFILIAVVLMLLVDHFIFGGKRNYIEKARQQDEVSRNAPIALPSPGLAPGAPATAPSTQSGQPAQPVQDAVKLAARTPDTRKIPPDGADALNGPEQAQQPQWRRNAVLVKLNQNHAKIAIIIDDMGMDVRRSRQVMELPGPLSLAFLPYAPQTPALAKTARKKGYELLIHTPMEPLDPALDMGDMALRADMEKHAFVREFDRMAGSFGGYVGINNHMGSRLTQDPEKMGWLMAALRARGLLFVDSRTIHSSVAALAAQKGEVPYTVRDVFLDHVPGPQGAEEALRKVESIARTHGVAVAIGHPKDDTIAALKDWLPGLADKGFQLVPVSALVGPVEGGPSDQPASGRAPAQALSRPRQ